MQCFAQIYRYIIWPLGTYVSGIFITTQRFSIKKMLLKAVVSIFFYGSNVVKSSNCCERAFWVNPSWCISAMKKKHIFCQILLEPWHENEKRLRNWSWAHFPIFTYGQTWPRLIHEDRKVNLMLPNRLLEHPLFCVHCPDDGNNVAIKISGITTQQLVGRLIDFLK